MRRGLRLVALGLPILAGITVALAQPASQPKPTGKPPSAAPAAPAVKTDDLIVFKQPSAALPTRLLSGAPPTGDLGSAARSYVSNRKMKAGTVTTVTAAQAAANNIALSAFGATVVSALTPIQITLTTVAAGTSQDLASQVDIVLLNAAPGQTYLVDASVAEVYEPSIQMPCLFNIVTGGQTQTISCDASAPNTNHTQHLLFGISPQSAGVVSASIANVYQSGRDWWFWGATITQLN